MEIAFGSEFSNPDSAKIWKWQEPLSIGVFGAADGAFVSLLERHLDQVSELTGLSATFSVHRSLEEMSSSVDAYNVFAIVPRSDAEFQFLLKNSDVFTPFRRSIRSNDKFCAFRLFADQNGVIGIAFVLFTPASDGPEVLYCVIEEFTQILGLTRDSNLVGRTVFNDNNIYWSLTELDILLLRALYSDKIQAGMTKEEVTPLLPGIYREITRK